MENDQTDYLKRLKSSGRGGEKECTGLIGIACATEYIVCIC